MEHKKIQFLVPQYKENEETISFLLDSIESQLHMDKKDIVRHRLVSRIVEAYDKHKKVEVSQGLVTPQTR